MTLFLMLSAFAKADTDYTFVFTTEYSSVPCIYAGSPNYFKLEVKNTGGTDAQNVVAELFIDEERIWNETIASVPAGQEVSLDAVDYTIRPIMENTIWGDDHDTIDDAPWYGLDGRKLDGIPTQKGVYIRGNKKVVIL